MSRSTEFTVPGNGDMLCKRCLAQYSENLNPMKRNTL